MSRYPSPATSPVQRYLPRLLFAAVLLPMLFFAGWYVCWRWSNVSAIRRLEAKARKNGEPLTYPELAACYPAIPDNKNGAAALMDAWEKDDPLFWRLFRDREQHLPELVWRKINPMVPYLGEDSPKVGRTNDIGITSLEAAEEYLRQRKQHLDEIHGALVNSNFWFPVNMSRVVVPHLPRLKEEALSFSIQALVASEHGDLDSAIRAIEDTAHTGNALVAEPVEVSQVVRLVCYHIALGDSERLLSRRTLSAEQLNRLSRLCDELRVCGGLRSALLNDRVRDLDNLDDIERGPFVNVYKPMQFSRRTVLTVYDHLLSLGDPYTPGVLHEYDSVYSTAKKFDADTNAPETHTVCWAMLGNLELVARKFVVFEVHRQAAITALAVEHYRIDHRGDLPKQLSDLVPKYLKELPLDPIDGRPLRFQRLPVGFVVYSIDFNGVDNGWDEPRYRDMFFMVQR